MFVEIEEIAKEFGTGRALHPVSLSIPSGALIALLITLAVNLRYQRDFAREWAMSLRVKSRSTEI